MCQMFKKGKDFKRPYQKRINLNVLAMTKISMDIKQMLVHKGYSHIMSQSQFKHVHVCGVFKF